MDGRPFDRRVLQRRASNSLLAPGGFLRNLGFRGVERGRLCGRSFYATLPLGYWAEIEMDATPSAISELHRDIPKRSAPSRSRNRD